MSGFLKRINLFPIYLNKYNFVVFCLGMVCSMPYVLLNANLNAWLAIAGVSKSTIGLFGILSLPYTLKFCAAPFIDSISIPYLSKKFGRRRSWLLCLQVCLFISIILLGSTNPKEGIEWMAICAAMVAFFSASQDIILDAYRVEIIEEKYQGIASSVVVIGYRFGAVLVGGLGLLFVEQLCVSYGLCSNFLNWKVLYFAVAVILFMGFFATYITGEPVTETTKEHECDNFGSWLLECVVAPFKDFMQREKWVFILALVIIYRACDAFLATMLSPFLIDVGFTLTEIGLVVKSFGFVASVAGGVLGGFIVYHWGLFKAMCICAALQMLSNAAFIVQANIGYDINVLYVAIAIENGCGGCATTAFCAYISKICSRSYTATQFALFSSMAMLDKVVMSSVAGVIADSVTWQSFFGMSMLLGLPPMFLLYKLKKEL